MIVKRLPQSGHFLPVHPRYVKSKIASIVATIKVLMLLLLD